MSPRSTLFPYTTLFRSPENILFSQGHPIVADFGIAKAVSTAGGANLTRTGFPVGTPGYMSPEQAAGLTELDERTDVYRSEEHTSELQSHSDLVCRLLLE